MSVFGKVSRDDIIFPMKTAPESVNKLAQIIWDYHKMNHKVEPADLIFVLGSHDLRVADEASRLYLKGFAPRILFSGNKSLVSYSTFDNGIPEAIRFKRRAIELGVPEEVILVEPESTDTGENIINSHRLLLSLGLESGAIIAVQKPYMERRTYATLRAQWPAPQPMFMVTSQEISFLDFINDNEYSPEYTINAMVGDLQRIKDYPKKGFQIEQNIPDDVWSAFKELVAMGYDKRLIKD